MINDISGGQFDPNMMQTVGKQHAPYVLMHLLGTPKDMQKIQIQKCCPRSTVLFF